MDSKRTTISIPNALWRKLVVIKKERGYSSITHILTEAIRNFIEQEGY